MSLLRTWSAIASLALVSWHAHAHACSFSEPEKLEIEANPDDVTSPSKPTVTVSSVTRGDSWDDGDEGCGGGEESSCRGTSFVVFKVSASDDVTAGSALGYFVDSSSTPTLTAETRPQLPDEFGNIILFMGANDSGENDLSLNLHIFAVDKAGNISEEPALVRVRDEGSKGCQLAQGAGSGALFTASMLTLLLWRRRRVTRLNG